MGFEQLAELKKQLAAARAEAAPAAKPAAKPGNKPGARPARKSGPPRHDGAKGAKPQQGAHGASGNQGAERAPRPQGAAAQTRPADAKPVDPVVKSIGRLQKRFPNAFPKNPAPKLPLKVGIFEDLVVHSKDLSLSEAELRDAIKTWCRGSRYWKCLVEGAARVDLTGAESGTVTAQEAAGAQRLQAHRANKGAKTAANAAANAAASATGNAAEGSAAGQANAPVEASATPAAEATDAAPSHEAAVSDGAETVAESAGSPADEAEGSTQSGQQ